MKVHHSAALGYAVTYGLAGLGAALTPVRAVSALAGFTGDAVCLVLALVAVFYLHQAFTDAVSVLVTPSTWQVIASACLITGASLLSTLDPIASPAGAFVLFCGILPACLHSEWARQKLALSITGTRPAVILLSLALIVLGAIVLPFFGLANREYGVLMAIWAVAFVSVSIGAVATRTPQVFSKWALLLDA